MIHSYSESYRTDDGDITISIHDDQIELRHEGDLVARLTSSGLFHLAALFTRAFGRASAPELKAV